MLTFNLKRGVFGPVGEAAPSQEIEGGQININTVISRIFGTLPCQAEELCTHVKQQNAISLSGMSATPVGGLTRYMLGCRCLLVCVLRRASIADEEGLGD